MKATTTVKLDEFPPYPGVFAEFSGAFEFLFEHLSVNLLSALHYRCSPEWRLRARAIQNSYITIVTAGKGLLNLGGKEFELGENSVILFHPGIEHSMVPLDGSSMSMINIHFDAISHYLIDLPALLALNGVFVDATSRYTRIAHEIVRLFAKRPPGWRAHGASLTRSMLMDMVLREDVDLSPPPRDLSKLSRLWPALKLIESDFRSPALSASDLASAMGVSDVYARKLFKDMFGEPPGRYLMMRRIREACAKLVESDAPIKTIAFECGYNDLSFFYRLFGKVAGTTPAAYRAENGF